MPPDSQLYHRPQHRPKGNRDRSKSEKSANHLSFLPLAFLFSCKVPRREGANCHVACRTSDQFKKVDSVFDQRQKRTERGSPLSTQKGRASIPSWPSSGFPNARWPRFLNTRYRKGTGPLDTAQPCPRTRFPRQSHTSPSSASEAETEYLSAGGIGRPGQSGSNTKDETRRPSTSAPLPAPLA